ncbi:protein kinase domain-containing protein, partial [Sporichthya brevicatena]|uniref:protein kinase domain-containing protein n=1 Tax=Sporichthya brevicatena TaxID=171442 RepID=UPI0031D44C82
MTGETQPNNRPMLGGRYRLDERIARGGMGEVWRGTDEVLNRKVAVKVLRPEYADEEIFLERFRSEARNTAALVHTGIAQVYDFGQAPAGGASVPFIVMELVPGEPLSHIIEREGRLEIDRALELVAQAAQALQVAHTAGVIHRDIKPANLLITPSWTVKVTDFGIARAGDALPLTRSGTVMGTAHYLAPELISTKSGAAPASDVYALGVVLYECLAGRRPFTGDNPLAVAMAHLHNEPPPIEGVPPAVNRMVATILAKDPAQRPQSAADLAQRLLALRIDLANPKTAEVVAEALGPAVDPAAVQVAAARWTRRTRSGGRSGPDTPPAPPRPDPGPEGAGP